jgi:hypothetical protein
MIAESTSSIDAVVRTDKIPECVLDLGVVIFCYANCLFIILVNTHINDVGQERVRSLYLG